MSMTYSLSNNCTKNYYNLTLTVQVIVEDVVTWIFLRHSVYSRVYFYIVERCAQAQCTTISQCSTLVRNTVVRAILQAYGKW